MLGDAAQLKFICAAVMYEPIDLKLRSYRMVEQDQERHQGCYSCEIQTYEFHVTTSTLVR